MKKLHALLAATVVATAWAGGCSGDETAAQPEPSCNDDPWSCAAGQTCWPNVTADKFECFTAGPGKVGDTCLNVVGQPTCAQDLGCLQLQGQPDGLCTAYCDLQDPAHACPTGLACLKVLLQTPAGKTFTVYMCETEGLGGAGGASGAGGSAGAGGTGGAGGSGGTGG